MSSVNDGGSGGEALEVARKLTKAQRGVVLACDDKLRLPRDIGVHTNALLPLLDLWRSQRGLEPPIQLVRRDYIDWPRLAWVYALTPLGMAVRSLLATGAEQSQ